MIKKIDSISTPIILCFGLIVVSVLMSLGGSIWTRVGVSALISVVFVVGLSVFTANSGIMSFGHVAFMAVGAYVTAYLTIPKAVKRSTFPDLPEYLHFLYEVETSFIVAIIVAGVIAAIMAVVASAAITRMQGLPSGIATLALLVMTYTIINSWTSVTRGSSNMIGVPRSSTVLIVTVIACLAVVVAFLFNSSRWGLELRAVREDFDAAQAVGIVPARPKLTGWLLSAFLCGVAGSLYAGYFTIFSSNTFFLTLTFSFIVMIVVGGYISLSGAVIGALGISLLQEMLRRLQDGQFTSGSGLPPGTADLILAILLLVVLMSRPLGIMGDSELKFSSFIRRKSVQKTQVGAAS